MSTLLETNLKQMPVVAIIRGVEPEQASEIGAAIYEAGIGTIEVPLNSPRPFESIRALSDSIGDRAVIGCGTLTRIDDAKRVADAGGQIAVTPNTDVQIIKRCIALGMTPMPGWATPTEAFTAYNAGARYLKLFPAGSYGTSHVQAVRAVLPSDAAILAVGGVNAANASQWLDAGALGLGIGSDIFKPGRSATDVYQRSCDIVNAIENAISTKQI